MRKYNPGEEKKVLELLAQGNEFSFTLLFDHYRGRIFSVALKFLKSRELAEEVVQEVFLKIWSRREDLTRVLDFEAYLFTVARNLIFDLIKDIAKETTTRNDFINRIQRPSVQIRI